MGKGFLDDILDNVGESWSEGKMFSAGTHTVVIGLAEAVTDTKDRNIIKVTVFDPEDNDRVGEATLWFHSEGGAKMAVAKVMGLLVHNTDESKKDKVKELGKKVFGGMTDLEKIRQTCLELITEKLIGKEAYFVVNPNGKYTTSKYGDLWHYPRELDAAVNKAADKESDNTVDPSEIPDFSDI